jgi:hypothetical protein
MANPLNVIGSPGRTRNPAFSGTRWLIPPVAGLYQTQPQTAYKLPKKTAWVDNPSGLIIIGSPGRTRTCGPVVNSHLLYQLSYRGTLVNTANKINEVL